MFRAIVIDRDTAGQRVGIQRLEDHQLPDGDVTVAVEYSTLNYKDALAISGRAPVVRRFPMVPGIDLAGVVTECASPAYKPGDKVLLNGWGVGEEHWGGLAQKARLRSDWLIPLPDGMSSQKAMAIGTAGYTAMLCILALERHGLQPTDGDVLVTGAAGGVGSFAVLLLARLGYRVIASTGRSNESSYLQGLGAAEIIDRKTLSEAGKPLQRERWAAAVDSIGSHTLANVCASTRADGLVAACGMAQGLDLPGSVAPFILRGVSLLGINSVSRPRQERVVAWQRLAALLENDLDDTMVQRLGLEQVPSAAQHLLDGQVRGRLVVDVNQ